MINKSIVLLCLWCNLNTSYSVSRASSWNKYQWEDRFVLAEESCVHDCRENTDFPADDKAFSQQKVGTRITDTKSLLSRRFKCKVCVCLCVCLCVGGGEGGCLCVSRMWRETEQEREGGKKSHPRSVYHRRRDTSAKPVLFLKSSSRQGTHAEAFSLSLRSVS